MFSGRFIWILLLGLPVLLSGESPLYAEEPAQFNGVTLSYGVHVRSEPRLEASSVAKVAKGTKLDLRATGTVWLKVVSGPYAGNFVHVRNLSLSPMAEGAPVIKAVSTQGAANWLAIATAVCAGNPLKAEAELSWIPALNGGHDAAVSALKSAWVYRFAECEGGPELGAPPIAVSEPRPQPRMIATQQEPPPATVPAALPKTPEISGTEKLKKLWFFDRD
jgi:hypothetical protein